MGHGKIVVFDAQRARVGRGRRRKAFHGSCVCRGRTFDLVDHEGAGVELGLQGLVVGLRHLGMDGGKPVVVS